MKSPWEWEEEDVQLLINDGVQESLFLEFKGCEALKKDNETRSEVSKDISSFANSAGGTIVYGLIEENHFPKKIDVGYDPSEITKEWLEQIINSNIQQRVDNLKIKQIRIKQTGKVLYVVNIPQSFRAPHMASDHKFYKRFNFHSVPMEEYEVRDVAHRNEAPALSLNLYPIGAPLIEFGTSDNYSKVINFNLIIQNTSETPAMYHLIRFYIDNRLKVHKVPGFQETGNLGFVIRTDVSDKFQQYETKGFAMNSGIPGKMPVWKGTNFKMNDHPISISFPKESLGTKFLIKWVISSPGMVERDENFFLITKENYFVLEPSDKDKTLAFKFYETL